MASLDVESLFTKIPLDKTIKNAVDDLFSNNVYQGKLSKSNGISMDLLLGPTLANAFLCHYKKLWLDNCPP